MALRELLIKTDSRCTYQMLWWGVPVGPPEGNMSPGAGLYKNDQL